MIHSWICSCFLRFFQLKVYDKLSKHNPSFSYVLMERNLSSQYIFDKPVAALSVASHSYLIAFAFKDDSKYALYLTESPVKEDAV